MWEILACTILKRLLSSSSSSVGIRTSDADGDGTGISGSGWLISSKQGSGIGSKSGTMGGIG